MLNSYCGLAISRTKRLQTRQILLHYLRKIFTPKFFRRGVMAKQSNDLEAALREAVELQVGHRSSPKQERLLNLLSKDTSSALGGGSISQASPKQNDERLIASVMEA